jgi:hypothetical protein
MRNGSISASSPNGLVLRVDFEWWQDRYRHTISIIDQDGATTPFLQSIEGSTEQDWPPSPPFQTLSVEWMSDSRTVALLVGMAGGSHWSASVEPAIGEAKIVFDIACRYIPDRRFPRPPGRLGSSYLTISPLVNNRLSIESSDATVLDASGVIEIVPREITTAGTTRWRFTLCTKY